MEKQIGRDCMKEKRTRIRETFLEYTDQYDRNDPNILLKIIHTEKVAENSERIARSLGMTEEEVQIAWEIGMMHDIGRFEQLRKYHTFNDAISIDHASYGADLLFQEGLIERFGIDAENYDLIEKAVRFHSMYRIPEDLSEEELRFCKILRDADKIDIYRANYETGVHVVYNVTEQEFLESTITPEVYEVFLEERTIPRAVKQTVADNLIGHIALSYELEYPISRIMVKEQGFYEKLLQTTFRNEQTNSIMEKVRAKMDEWFREKEK